MRSTACMNRVRERQPIFPDGRVLDRRPEDVRDRADNSASPWDLMRGITGAVHAQTGDDKRTRTGRRAPARLSSRLSSAFPRTGTPQIESSLFVKRSFGWRGMDTFGLGWRMRVPVGS